MLQHPQTVLRLGWGTEHVVDAAGDEVDPSAIETVRELITHLEPTWGDGFPGGLQVTIEQLPPRHIGLGSGTQLSLAMVDGLYRLTRRPPPSVHELVVHSGRAQRSAIGSHGYREGGLLVDRGKAAEDPYSPLDFRGDFPPWPVVLAVADQSSRVFGEQEKAAFENLPATPPDQREQQIRRVRDQLVPALLVADYPRFAEAVFQFGFECGSLFAPLQGGPYNGAAVSRLVHVARDCGVPAVGQSSWGPGVFAIAPDRIAAEGLAECWRQSGDAVDVWITAADNRGAVCEEVPLV